MTTNPTKLSINDIKYKGNYKTLKKSFFAVFFSAILLINIPFLQDSYAVTQTVTIDLSAQPNTVTFPYGTCYDGIQYVYVTIFASGQLAKVDKNDLSYSIKDNDAGTAGFDWYSCAVDPTTGKVVVNEKDTGRLRIFDPSDNSFETLALPADISGGVVSYTEGYTTSPHKITINGGGCNNNVQEFGFGSFGEIKITNGFAWVAIDYNYDFSGTNEACGATDVSFHGIIKVNLSTETIVSRTAIANAEALRGMDIDDSDSTILLVSDLNADKIYQFDTDTLSVTKTFTLSANSKCRGITDDGTNIYCAKNEQSDGTKTGKIIQIVKLTETQSEIDTGITISNGNNGLFEVEHNNGVIYWSDENGHIGTYVISTTAKTKTDTTDINSNHFGVVVDGNYWIAGKGSAKVTITPLISFGGEGGSSDKWKHLQRPTIGKKHTPNGDGKQLVDYGFTWCGKKYQITDNWHTPFEKVEVKIGESCDAKIKIFSKFNLHMVELALVPDVGQRHNAETAISVFVDHLRNVKYIEERQNDRIVKSDLTAKYEMVECTKIEADKIITKIVIGEQVVNETELLCHEITIDNIMFMEEPFFEKIAITVIDESMRMHTTYLNEGFDITGVSLNPPKTDMMASGEKGIGLVKMTLIDKFTNTWITEDGMLYTTNKDNSWIRLSPIEIPQWCSDKIVNVMTRSYCSFDDLKQYEIDKATAYLKSNYAKLFTPSFAEIDNTFAYDIPRLPYTDCDGNLTSQKSQDCAIQLNMKNQERIAKETMERKY